MKHLLFITAFSLTGCLLAPAVTPFTISAQVTGRNTVTIDGVELREEQLFDLTLHPAPLKKPALKHRLTPATLDTIDRNAATFYYRTVTQAKGVDARIRQYNREQPETPLPYLFDDYDAWMNSDSLEEDTVEQMRNYVNQHKTMFEELERAYRSSYCNWDLIPDDKEDFNWYEINLDDIQYLRQVCRVLAVANRVALYDGDYERAIKCIAYGLKIAHDLESAEIMVAGLVGVACAGISIDNLQKVIQETDSPNLYWALATLPKPLANFNPAIRRELSILLNGSMFETLANTESLELTASAWRKLFLKDVKTTITFGNITESESTLEAMFGVVMLRAYPIAKHALVERGFDPDEVAAMPAAQVIAIQQKHAAQIVNDEILKTLNLDYPTKLKYLNDNRSQFLDSASLTASPNSETQLLPFQGFFFPAVQQTVSAEARIQRNLAGLQVIEAIRAHLAVAGELPNSLADITVLAVPVNPATNQPFEYQINEYGATLKLYGLHQGVHQFYQLRVAK